MLPLSLGREEDCCPNFLSPPHPCFYFGKLRISPGHLLPKANVSGEPRSPPRLCPHFFPFLPTGFHYTSLASPGTHQDPPARFPSAGIKDEDIQLISWSPLVPSPPSFCSLEPVPRLCLEFFIVLVYLPGCWD